MIVGSYFSVTWIGFKEYVKLLILSVPLDVYIALILLWIIAVVISFLLKNWKKSIPLLSQLFLLEYVFLVFCSTVIYREIFEGSSVHLEPFWSYFDKESGMFVLRAEHIMNILVFIPIGFCIVFFNKKHALLKSILAGIVLSTMIELSQLYFKRGFCEVDDVINNTLGSVLGCSISMLLLYLFMLPKNSTCRTLNS